MKTNQTPAVFGKRFIGCVLDCSCDSADAINERTIKFAQGYGFDAGEWQDEIGEDDEDRSQVLSELADDAVNWLNEQDLLPYCSFCFEDNSLFYMPNVESARDDVGFVSRRDVDETTDQDDASYPAADYRGEWLHVSDHGNATLYVRGENGQDTEVWSLV